VQKVPIFYTIVDKICNRLMSGKKKKKENQIDFYEEEKCVDEMRWEIVEIEDVEIENE
jgi:hypothetical protein